MHSEFSLKIATKNYFKGVTYLTVSENKLHMRWPEVTSAVKVNSVLPKSHKLSAASANLI